MTSRYALFYRDKAVKPASNRGSIGAAKVSVYAQICDRAVSFDCLTDRAGFQWKIQRKSLQYLADLDVVDIRGTENVPVFQIV